MAVEDRKSPIAHHLTALRRHQHMLKNLLVVALRNLRRRKGYALINVVGLSIGIACCLLVGLYIADALSYDRFHEKADRLYRLTYSHRIGEGLPPAAPEEHRVWGSAAIAPLLRAEFPEVEHTVRLSGQHMILLRRGERRFQEERYLFADSTFFAAFSFPLLQGDPRTALTQPGSIVLTEGAARRYFGDEDPMGQPIRFGEATDVTVTGVLADPPPNTHLDFDMLLSMASFEQTAPDHVFESWGYADFFTYVLLHEGAAPEALEAKLPAFIQRHIGDKIQDPPQTFTLALEPITEAYLSPVGGRQIGPKGSEGNLYIFGFIGLFILLIACVNFMNLATAQGAQRAKEVGVRKTLGAQRGALAGQFLLEATLLALAATALALVLVDFALPAFRGLAGREVAVQPLADPRVLAGLGLVALVVGLFAGSYPALVLSGFRPSQVLKGRFAVSAQGTALRKGLVVFQFAAAIALIAGTLVVRTQLVYLQSQPLGFDKEQQLVLDFGGDDAVQAQLETIKHELAEHPAVRSVAATRSVPGSYFPHAGTVVEASDGAMRDFTPGLYEVDYDFLPQLGVGVAAGRLFDRDFSTDSTAALILNEAAVRALGYASPDDVIGKRFTQWGREGEVVGVVEDFNVESLRAEIKPLTFRIEPRSTRYLVLTVAAGEVSQTMTDLRARWAALVPHRPFLFSFLDASFDALYRDDERFGRLFGVFAALAIAVACLGLFGLAAYAVEQRTKEIGVRKVLGARVPGLVALLSKEFTLLVVTGFAVAAPASYLLMGRWLDGFAYRATIGPGVFLLAGALALAVALLTVGYHTVRAAMTDPVEALHYE